MPLKFIRLRNKNTGEFISIPQGRYGNFLNKVKKVVNFVRYNMPVYYLVHLTLTVAENTTDIGYENLHRVITFIDTRLKRCGTQFKYIAVKEYQSRGAIHYHILCMYDKPNVFPSTIEVAKSWKLGFVKITAPKTRIKLNKIVGYIGKYIGKGYEYDVLETKKSFTASQIKQIYKLSPSRLDEVFRRFGKKVAEEFECTYRRVFLVGNEIINDILGRPILKKFKDLIMEFQSDWEVDGERINVKGKEYTRPYFYTEKF